MSEVSGPPIPAGRWFITGAGGFIGRHLSRRILEAGGQVTGADLRDPGDLPAGLDFVACDIRDSSSVREAAAAFRVDYGVHLAACVGDWGDRAVYEATNVGGTANVLGALITAGARRIVHISSIVVMGYEPGYDADEAVGPMSQGDLYTDTKAGAEEVARQLQAQGAPVTIVRPGDVYGPGSEPWVERPTRMMRAGQMMLLAGGRGHFAHVYVDNLVDGIILAATHPDAGGQTYIITDGEASTDFKSYFTRLAEATGSPPPRLSLPRPLAWLVAGGTELAARAFGFQPPLTRAALKFIGKRCSYRIDKARRELGYAPRVGLDEGLARVRASFLGR